MAPCRLPLSRVGLSLIWRYIQRSVDQVTGKAENLEFSLSRWNKHGAEATPKGAVGQALTNDSTSLRLLQRASHHAPSPLLPAPFLTQPDSPAPPAPPLDPISTSTVPTLQGLCHPCAVSHTLVFLLCWNYKLFSGLLSGVRKVPFFLLFI